MTRVGPFRVFTPYWNRWRAAPRRAALAAPPRIPTARAARRPGASRARRPDARRLQPRTSHGAARRQGRARLARWLRDGLAAYDERRDDLAVEGTSGLSPYLHFGCVSPLEVAASRGGRAGRRARSCASSAGATSTTSCSLPNPGSYDTTCVRVVTAGATTPPGSRRGWRGRTGYPIVDAGMRQLAAEGTMHNRARLVTASFLAKHLYVDWRLGAAHFAEHLVDGDVANNVGNWQWVAGNGSGHASQPRLQSDAAGPSLRSATASTSGAGCPSSRPSTEPDVHEPWRLGRRRPAQLSAPDRRPRGSRAAVPRRLAEPSAVARRASRTASSNGVRSIGTSSRMRSSSRTIVGVRSPSIERSGDGRVDGRHEMEPPGGQARREHRHLDDRQPLAADASDPLDHLRGTS